MAAPAGSLVVRIGADTKGLNRGARQAESRMSKMGRGAAVVAARMAALGAAAVAAGGAIAVGLVKSGLTAIDTQAKLAQSIGGTIDSVRALQIAAEDAGVSTQEMAANLQRMNRRLGEVVSTGAGPAAKWIEQLGINAQSLIDMPLDQRVAVIADEIAQLGSTAEMASAAFAIFGDAGLRMVPMLQQGGDAIRAAAREVDEFGISLSEVDAAQVEAANDAMSRIGRVIESIRNQTAIAVAGPLKAFADWFATISKEGTTFRNTISQAFAVVGRYIGVAVDIGGIMVMTFQKLYGVVTTVVSAIGDGFAWLAEDFRKAVNQIIRGINTVANFLPLIEGGIEEIQPGWIGRRFEDTMSAAETAVAFSMEAIREYLGGKLPSENLEAWLEEVREKSRQAAEAAVAARGAMVGGVAGTGEGGDSGDQEAFDKRLEAIRDRYLTEEKLEREHLQIMSDIKRAWETGEFETEEEYRNVREQAEKEHLDRLKNLRESSLTDLERFTNASYAKQVDIASGHLADMTASVAHESKAMFKINKAAALATATVDAIKGAEKTWDSYPYPWNVPMTAAHVAGSIARLAAIKSSTFNGSGGVAPSVVGTTPAPPVSPVGGSSGGGQSGFVQDVSVTLVGGNSIGIDQLNQLGEILADNGGKIGRFRVRAA